jgi:hypothetical protein
MEESHMRKAIGFAVLGSLIMFAGILPAGAQECPTGTNQALITCAQVQYHGGPVLEDYTIHPLYFGNWTQDQIDTQQAFLQNLAAYISGESAPAGQQPTVWQYGPRSATVAAAVWVNKTTAPDDYKSTCGSPKDNLFDCDVRKIISDNQGSGANKVPEFGPERVIVLLPAPGFTNSTCGCGGYHGSENDSSFYAIIYYATSGGGVYADATSYYQAVTSHEIFEDATDPAVDSFWGWVSVPCKTLATPCPSPSSDEIAAGNLDKEIADQCDTVVTLANWPGGTLQFAKVVDNTLNGACTLTGYMPLTETAMYGLSKADFENQNTTEFGIGYQLYILQSYVSNGDTYYDAVWRPQSTGSTPGGGAPTGLYYANQMVDAGYPIGTPESGYLPRFQSLHNKGWRLYYFQTAVQNSSPVGYNAVWRQGTEFVDTKEDAFFAITYENFRTEYEANFPAPEQWRLYNLQETSSDWIDAVWHQPDGPHYSSKNFADNNPPTACNCSDELHIYQGTLTQYQTDYKNFYAQGFRLYTLNPYVTSDGTVLYNAIWRSTRTYEEVPIYGKTLAEYQKEYEAESKDGFYLYILSVYVVPGANGDTVLYDAVFRRGMFDRPL